jgi:hypothetical protein
MKRHACIQSADCPGYCRRCAEPVVMATPFYPGQKSRAAQERYMQLMRNEDGTVRMPRRPA